MEIIAISELVDMMVEDLMQIVSFDKYYKNYKDEIAKPI